MLPLNFRFLLFSASEAGSHDVSSRQTTTEPPDTGFQTDSQYAEAPVETGDNTVEGDIGNGFVPLHKAYCVYTMIFIYFPPPSQLSLRIM